MSEMVDRVAKAIKEEFGPIYGHLCREEDARNCAVAAIKAMREPGEKVLSYVEDGSAPKKGAKNYNDWANHHYDARGFWNVLIDEALK